jgi:hypothetical protein
MSNGEVMVSTPLSWSTLNQMFQKVQVGESTLKLICVDALWYWQLGDITAFTDGVGLGVSRFDRVVGLGRGLEYSSMVGFV